MKKFIVTSAAVLITYVTAFTQNGTSGKKWYRTEADAGPGFSRDLEFHVHGRYTRPVKTEQLNEARFLHDFIPGYPVNWVTDYVSVEIVATCDGKTMKAASLNEVLSTEQKNILRKADLATDIVINVRYRYPNPVTSEIGDYNMHVSMTVLPEKEAEYVGGYKQLIKYLNENCIRKISETVSKQLGEGIVVFTVNENGEIENAKIFQTSGDTKADKLLLEVIHKMPKWRPAENSKGIKVKQEFEFSIGNGGC